jgi:hypothetical protein
MQKTLVIFIFSLEHVIARKKVWILINFEYFTNVFPLIFCLFLDTFVGESFIFTIFFYNLKCFTEYFVDKIIFTITNNFFFEKLPRGLFFLAFISMMSSHVL